MKGTVIIDVPRLMVVLNELFKSGKEQIKLIMPYLSKPVFTLHLAAENSPSKTSRLIFHHKFSDYQQIVSRQKNREIPDFNQVQSLLIKSGIVDYPNFYLFLAELHRMCQRNFLKGDRQLFLCLDTNLYLDSFFSAHYSLLKNIPNNKIDLFISPYVKDEMTFDRKKYKTGDMKKLAQYRTRNEFKYFEQEFFNQPSLLDRLGRLGFSEIEKAMDIFRIELLPELDERELEPTADLNIIKTYKLAVEERNVDIFLVSKDDGFIGHAEGIPGIRTFFMETGKISQHSEFQVRYWRQFCKLIYAAAVTFGVIQLQHENEYIQIEGIWKGKKTQDWNDENIRISVAGGNTRLFQNCSKVWKILEKQNWMPD